MGKAVRVEEWRLTMLLEAARKNFGPYARYYTAAWVKNITKNGPLPKSEKEWAETEEDT